MKKLLTSILALTLLVTDWVLAQGLPAVTETRLDNGLKVLMMETPNTGAISVGCWYRAGSKDEPLGSTGISHWVEHMTFQGTQNLSGTRFRQVIAEAGGVPNGYTFLDQTGYFTTVANTTLEPLLLVESERMTSCLMDPAEADRQRQGLVADIQHSAANPRNLLDVDVTAAALKIHPYRWPTIGWSRDLEKAAPELLQEFYRQFYAPNNAVLVLVGDFQSQKALDLVKKYFARIARKLDPPRILSTEPAQEGERRLKIIREGESNYLEIAYHASDILNDEFYALLILDSALNGVQGMNIWTSPSLRPASRSSRLYKALVEKKLAVRVDSALFLIQQPYLYKFMLKLPDAFQYQPAEEAVFEELERLKNQGLKDHELAKAWNQLISRSYLEQDSLGKLAHQLGFFESMASYKVLSSLEEKINRITNDDLRRLAIKVFAEDSRTVGWYLPVKKPQKIEVEKLSSAVAPVWTLASLRPAFQNLKGPKKGGKDGAASPGTVRNPQVLVGPLKDSVGDVFAGIPHPQISIQPLSKTLSNGLAIIVAENRVSPTLTIKASMRAGSLRDRDETAGLANFVGRMLERGSKSKNVTQVAEGFDFLGADLSVDTDYLTSTLTVNGLSRDTNSLIQQLSDLLQSPAFPPSEMEKVRAEILSELREEAGDAQVLAEETLRGKIYPSQHAFGRNIKGFPKAVELFKASDLTDFYKRYYRPDSLVISIAGAVNPQDVLQVVEERFGKWTVTGTRESFSIPSASPGLGKGQHLLNRNLGPDCEIALGFPGISRTNSDYFTMLVIDQILGDSQSDGRLGRRLLGRENLAAQVFTSMDASISEGPWSIHVRTVPGQVDRVLEAIREEIGRIQSGGVSDLELTSAKRQLINLLPTRLEGNSGIATQLLEIQLFELGENYLSWYAGMIEGVTLERIKSCLQTRLPLDQAAVVIVGPYPPK